MPLLSSSIVKHQLASMEQVEEALARQTAYGGDLLTNLLELQSLSEERVSAALAESFGLTAAPVGELPRAAERVRRLVPADVAQRFACYPLEERAGVLALAVSEPLPAEVESDLGFGLGVSIVQHVAPLVRVRQAVARDYGQPLDERTARALARLEGRAEPSPSFYPEPGAAARLERPATVAPPVAVLTAKPSAEAPAPNRTPLDPKAMLRAVVREEPRPRRLGPYTAAMAERDLLNATSRDEVLESFFDFVQQYFEYSALFALHADLAEGRDAHGPGAPRSKVQSIGVSLDLPSSLAAVRDASSHLLARLGSGLDAALAKDLERRPGPQVLLLPIRVRGRTILVLYGDHGDADVDLTTIGDVISFAPLVAAALERLIVQKKRGRADAAVIGALAPKVQKRAVVPGPEERAQALASALSARRDAEVLPEPPRLPRAAVPATAPLIISRAPESGATTAPAPAASLPVTAPAPPAPASASVTAPAPPIVLPAITTPAPADARVDVTEPPVTAPAGGGPAEANEQPATLSSGNAGTPSVAPPAATRSVPAWSEYPAPEPTTQNRARPLAPVLGAPTPTGSSPPRSIAEALARPVIPVGRSSERPTDPGAPPVSRRPATVPPQIVDAGWEELSGGRSPFARGERGTRPGVGDSPPERRSTAAEESPDISVAALSSEAELAELASAGTWSETDSPGVPLASVSRTAAHSARPLPASHTGGSDQNLPSVIVDVAEDCKALLEQLLHGDASAGDRLVAAGAPGIAVLVAAFPGPLEVPSSRRPNAGLARASDSGPVLRTLARIGERAVPFLVVRTNDADAEVRSYATRLLGEIPTPESAHAVARRFFDGDVEVRRAALTAARLLASSPEGIATLVAELGTTASDRMRPTTVRLTAMETLAELRQPQAVPYLIAALEDNPRDIVQSARRALVVLARQDLGTDAPAWSNWWRGASARHRIEWLIDALTHETTEIRRAAGEELKALTREYFGYYDDLPPGERSAAQRQYRQWWETRGKGRFRS